MPVPLMIILGILAFVVGIVAIVFLVVPAFKGIVWLMTNLFKGIGAVIAHVFRFIGGMLSDAVRLVGTLITAIVFVPLILGNVVIGRWSAASHFGRGLQSEVKNFGQCIYRIALGHPAKFLLLTGLTEGIERRIPDAMAQSPGSDKPSRRTGQFDGYKIVGSLAGGGSGGRLFVAEPDEKKLAIFARAGHLIDQVVIKSFSIHDGSSLPQIIRESRALEAAKKLGLVLDHELNDQRFFYVMPYVPGDNLTQVTKDMHAATDERGLNGRQLDDAMTYMRDLLKALAVYHHGGLWHKDVKPDNIIVSAAEAHLVDLGLVTPLRSAMTLTTHGTEYFRDPEMVRMALRGAKVKDVDGVKFDLYGAGAVMYAVLENSFPAHGGLSQFSKKSPEALRWIVRRSMTELNKRYASADEMLADLRVVMSASDAYDVKPADLPSVRGGAAGAEAVAAVVDEIEHEEFQFGPEPKAAPVHVAKAASPVPPDAERVHPLREGTAEAARGVKVEPQPEPVAQKRVRPSLKMTDWLTGRYQVQGEAEETVNKDEIPGVRVYGIGIHGKEDVKKAVDDVRTAIGDVRDGLRSGKGLGESFGDAMENFAEGAEEAPRRHQAVHRDAGGATAREQVKHARARARAAQDRARKRMKGRAAYKNGPNAGVAVAFVILLAGVAGAIVLVKEADKRGSSFVASHDDGEVRIGFGDKTITFNLPEEWREQEERGSDWDIDALNELGAAHERSGLWKHLSLDDSALALTVGEDESDYEASAEYRESARVGRMVEMADARAERAKAAAEQRRAEQGGWSSGYAPGTRGSVLLLNLLPEDVEREHALALDALVMQFMAAGYEVVGLGDSDRDIELVARGRSIVGVSPATDEGAQLALSEWLDASGEGLKAALWIAAGEDRSDVDFQLVTPRSVEVAPFIRVFEEAAN